MTPSCAALSTCWPTCHPRPDGEPLRTFDADIQAAAGLRLDEALLNAVLAVDNNDARLPPAQPGVRPPTALTVEIQVVAGAAASLAGRACAYRGKPPEVWVRPAGTATG